MLIWFAISLHSHPHGKNVALFDFVVYSVINLLAVSKKLCLRRGRIMDRDLIFKVILQVFG